MIKLYTDHEATDEAVLLLIRKLGRKYPNVLASLMEQLPAGAETALALAEVRAERVRDEDLRNGVQREYPGICAEVSEA